MPYSASLTDIFSWSNQNASAINLIHINNSILLLFTCKWMTPQVHYWN